MGEWTFGLRGKVSTREDTCGAVNLRSACGGPGFCPCERELAKLHAVVPSSERPEVRLGADRRRRPGPCRRRPSGCNGARNKTWSPPSPVPPRPCESDSLAPLDRAGPSLDPRQGGGWAALAEVPRRRNGQAALERGRKEPSWRRKKKTAAQLTSDIPHVELEAVVHNALNVEALGRHDAAHRRTGGSGP